MGNKRILIPIARFEAARPLAADVFLHLVLNRKSIRIAEAKGSIPEALLERIRSKGYSHLEVSCEGEHGDPETFPLYLVAPKTSAETESALTISSGESAEDREPAGVAKDTEAFVAGSLLEKNSPAPTEAEAKIIPASSDDEMEATQISSPKNEEPTRVLSASAEDLDETAIAAAAKANFDGETALSAGEQEDEAEQRIKAGPAEVAAVFKVKSSDAEEEENDVIFQLEQKLETAKETLLAGGHFDLEKEKVEILRGAKSSILAAKISDRIIELKGQTGTDDAAEITDLASSLQKAEAGRDLSEETLARFSISKELEEVETIIGADRSETDRVIDLSEHLANYAKSRDEAKTLLDDANSDEAKDLTLKKSAVHRDFPQTASRLAAYLGHSLGYTHPKFLNELAIASICHFGQNTDDTALPPIAQMLRQDSNDEDQLVRDSRDVLKLLDAYFSDPECDKTEKDFNAKIFRRTAESLSKGEQIDAWNLKCWLSYLEQGGPTLETHSLCNRATASALKFMRSRENGAQA